MSLVAGYRFTCAVVGGGVTCWGRNTDGRLGAGTTTESYVPVAVTGLVSGVAGVFGGDSHTCAVVAGGVVKCWRDNLYGELGINSTTDSHLAVDVMGP